MLFEIAARNCRRYITTLANPDIVESVSEMVQGKEGVAVKDGPDVKQFGRVD